MCGRFSQAADARALVEQFRLAAEPEEIRPRWNVAPTQDVAVVRLEDGAQRRLAFLRWGLIPFWAKDEKIGYRTINARSETVFEKPAYRAAVRQRRCLVPATGFYEWKKEGKGKVPHFVRMQDGRPFGIAGLWERWEPPAGETVESCTLLTTTPNALLKPVHDRMPVILPPEDYDLWLDPAVQERDRLEPLLRAFPPDAMEAFPVSRRVNNPRADDATLVQPADGTD